MLISFRLVGRRPGSVARLFDRGAPSWQWRPRGEVSGLNLSGV